MMWIKSQNDRVILKVDYFRMIYTTFDITIEGYSEDYGTIALGGYETKERALEIMNNIFKNLDEGKYDMPLK